MRPQEKIQHEWVRRYLSSSIVKNEMFGCRRMITAQEPLASRASEAGTRNNVIPPSTCVAQYSSTTSKEEDLLFLSD
jgi:hypothetical protein